MWWFFRWFGFGVGVFGSGRGGFVPAFRFVGGLGLHLCCFGCVCGGFPVDFGLLRLVWYTFLTGFLVR